MTTPSSSGPAADKHSPRSSFRVVLLCLLGILALLFYRSLLPNFVLFSNDGPLGALTAASAAMPDAFKGMWQDLNWIGNNGGSAVPDITQGLLCLLGLVQFAKWFVPITYLFLGLSAWLFFRRLNLTPLACVLGALATMLNTDFFFTSCWGVGPQTICFGMNFLALAAVVGGGGNKWLRFILAGFAVGLAVTEGADIAAIFSLFVAAFVLYYTWVSEATPSRRVGLGVARLTLVVVFAVFMAAQSLNVLTGTAIKGIAGAEQTDEAREARWEWATQWSMPKRELLNLIVPGLFGYRMDTPDGGNYWGAAGRDPSWDHYFKNGQQGPPPSGGIRFGAGASYAGVLVVLVAVWAGLQSFRKEHSVFSPLNRKLLWFWLGVLFLSLLLAFGKHAPFYRLFYALPYVSAIRNPSKFFHVFSWALVIIFAFGVHGLSRRYLEIASSSSASLTDHLRNWWGKVRGFDRKWMAGCTLAIAASILGWLIYASSRSGLQAYLQTVQFDEEMAKAIARFSFKAVGWYLLSLTLAVAAVALVMSGWFAGRRAKWGGILLGVLLVADLARANLPWIIYWNYKEKYAANPVIDFLREKPYEQRVAIFPAERFIDFRRLPPEAARHFKLITDQLDGLYRIEWSQHLFLYYNIQSLDIIQEPRLASDKAAFEGALASNPVRRWELCNNRYLLAPTAFLELFNGQFDPVQKRWRVAMTFDIAPKPGIPNVSRYDQLTARASTNGQLAVFAYNGVLPRAKLYANWQVATNDPVMLKDWAKDLHKRLPHEWGNALVSQDTTDLATLRRLGEADFDFLNTVLLAEPLASPPGTNQNVGTVVFESYAPKHIKLRATATAPAVLLLNDKFDPNWKVFVDGKPEKLLRANFIMRGVAIPPGEHTVEFKFEPPVKALYVSLAAIGVGVLLLGFLIISTRREAAATRPPAK